MKVEVLVYTCSFRCGWETKDISSLSLHLRHRHLQATVGVHIVCSQLECCASFTRLDHFLQHLKSFHPINNRNYDGDHHNESAATCAAIDFPDEFKDFDTLQVVEQLRKSMLELFPPGVEDQIIKEQINGVTLLELDEPELKELGFVTMGQRKLVLRLVKAYNSHNNKVVYQSKVTPVPPQQSAFSNLAERIRETEGGKDILNQMRTDRYLNHSNRKMFIKICTEILIEEGVKAGYKRNYPPMEMKINLASSIVTVFPNLRSNIPGCKGHEHFYDHSSATGYLENTLRIIRKKLPIEEKSHKSRLGKRKCAEEKSSRDDTDDTADIRDPVTMEPIKEKVECIQQTVLTNANKEVITKAMEETFDYRRQEVNAEHPPITVLLNHYPRFKDGLVLLIEMEFQAMYPRCKSMESFVSLVPKILKRGHSFTGIKCDDETLKAVMILQKLLPPMNTKSKSTNETCAIIIFKGAGCDVLDFARKKPEGLIQPYLLALGNKQRPNYFYLILDGTPLPVGNDFLVAFYSLFASFRVLGVNYHSRLITFYNFWEALLLGTKPYCLVRLLFAELDNISME